MTRSRRLASFLALSRRQRWDFVRALVLLPCVRPALWVLGFQRLRDLVSLDDLGQQGHRAGSDVATIAEARGTAEMVEIAARRGIVKALCLERSLVLAWLLRRRGIVASLRIGVQHDDREFRAHAWIECGGVAVGEAADVGERFLPLIAGATHSTGTGRAGSLR